MYQFGPASFQMLSRHLWLVATELDSTALNCYCICSEAEDFIGEREMGQERGGGKSPSGYRESMAPDIPECAFLCWTFNL